MPALKPNTIFLTDEEDNLITRAALFDGDAIPLTDEEWARVKPNVLTKNNKTVQLSDEVVTAFQKMGGNWQILIDNVLKDWLKTHHV